MEENKAVAYVPLEDIRGIDAQVAEIKEMIATFKDKAELFEKLGADSLNRACLISGSVGSGKTNLAYAFAGAMQYPTKNLHCNRRF